MAKIKCNICKKETMGQFAAAVVQALVILRQKSLYFLQEDMFYIMTTKVNMSTSFSSCKVAMTNRRLVFIE